MQTSQALSGNGSVDVYPSRRLSKPSIIPRQDPVIYGNAAEAPISGDQIDFYSTNGFLIFPTFFSAREVAAFTREMESLQENQNRLQRAAIITEKDTNLARSLFAVHAASRLFSDLVSDERIVRIVEFVLGSRVYVHQARLNFKPGFSGKDFYWHSDFETWHVEDGMPGMRALSISLALCENTEFNGPLMLIPGSHRDYVTCVGETPDNHYKASLKRQDYGIPDHDSLRVLESRGGMVSVKGAPGSLVMFDCNTMHGSNSNISPYPRSNLFIVYNSMDNKLCRPFCGKAPRPEFIAARANVEPVQTRQNNFAVLS